MQRCLVKRARQKAKLSFEISLINKRTISYIINCLINLFMIIIHLKGIFEMKKKLILYELNEVPHRVIVEYIKIRPNSNLAKIISISEYCHTYTEDDGELHPWSTWPTIHRGF